MDDLKEISRCLENEIPVFVIAATDRCAIPAIKAYIREAEKIGCNDNYLRKIKVDVLGNFRKFQQLHTSQVKKPDL